MELAGKVAIVTGGASGLGRGMVELFAEAALYLASDRAAQITGIVLPVDGGTTAGRPPTNMKHLLAGADPTPR